MNPIEPQPEPTRGAPERAPRPPRAPSRPPWALLALLVIAGAAIGAGIVYVGMRPATRSATSGAAVKRPLYQCPMHPTITSDHPGTCPICGMDLVKVADDTTTLARATPAAGIAEGTPVPGLATVTIDPARQQLIGLRTSPVQTGPIAGSWRTVGRVAVDPTQVRKINVKVEGYIDRLYVDFVGEPVRSGQPLFALYSPSVLAAESEYLLALQTRDALKQAGSSDANGAELVEAARRKLELWDVPAVELRRLDVTREPSRSLTFLSPISGVVTAKNVVQGASVQAGDTPYEITDLEHVWVMADAYEGDLARVRVGMPAVLTLNAYPGRSFRGTVAFVDPVLDPGTRTAQIHMHFANPGGVLKPEMFGDVVLEGHDREGLSIPADAVVRAGTQDVVFVALGAGKFQPRHIELGAKSDGQVEVRNGLAAGEQVVTRANFLIDSESQLRAALGAMSENRP